MKISFCWKLTVFIFLFSCLDPSFLLSQDKALLFIFAQHNEELTRRVSSPHFHPQIPKMESSRWITRQPQWERRNMSQIFIYCSRPQNALDSWAGQKESGAKHAWIKWKPFLQGVWGRRNNKSQEISYEGENIFKVPSLRNWQGCGRMRPLLWVAIAAVVLVGATQRQTGAQLKSLKPAVGAAEGDRWAQGSH